MGTLISEGLTAAVLAPLKRGDSFTTEGFFQGVTATPCVWTVEEHVVKDKGAGAYALSVTYFGVQVGRFFARIKKNKVLLEEMR